MNISEYLELHNQTEEFFAGRIGVSQPTVNRYVTGKRKPNGCIMQKIFSVTNGEVSPNDFILTDKVNISQHFIYSHKTGEKNEPR